MERRNDIRAAIQNLLTPARPPEPGPPLVVPEPLAQRPTASQPGSLALSERQMRVMRDIQDRLIEYGVMADLSEILQGIVEALAVRPAMCRALLAAYLLEGGSTASEHR